MNYNDEMIKASMQVDENIKQIQAHNLKIQQLQAENFEFQGRYKLLQELQQQEETPDVTYIAPEGK